MFAIVDETGKFGHYGGTLVGPLHDTWFAAARYLLANGLRNKCIIVSI